MNARNGIACPNCGETEQLKEGATLADGRTFEFGCLVCQAPFNREHVTAGRAATDGGHHPASNRRRNPVATCPHDIARPDYIERADGQHEVTVCERCSVILADHGHPEPSNVTE